MCPAGCVSCGWAYQYPLHYGQVLRNEVVKAVFQRRHPLVLFFFGTFWFHHHRTGMRDMTHPYRTYMLCVL